VSYEIIEASVYDGDVIELYEFTMGTESWRFTSSVVDHTYAGNTYTAEALERSRVERAGEMNRAKITIMMDSNNDIARLFVLTQPRNMMSVRIFQGHRNDNDFRLQFSGRVTSCKWGKKRTAELTCEPEMTSWKRKSLQYNYSENCPYVVYSSLCRKTRSPFGGKVKAINGLVYTIGDLAASTPEPRLIGGTISLGASARTITAQTNTTYAGSPAVNLTLTAHFEDVAVGDSVSMVIGCNHSTTACKEWHNNIANFGGEPYIPEKNPFRGRIAT